MTRGRKPKDPELAWLKNPPAHLVAKQSSPEWVKKHAEQIENCKASSNMWRELRRQGVTPEYLEALDSLDPELMGPSERLTWAQAQAKYPDAFSEIAYAKERNTEAAIAGAEITRENSSYHHAQIIEAFPDDIKKFKAGERTITQTARAMLKKNNINWGGLWDKAEAPCLKTLTNILRNLAKATS
jgi:hypothetical protein